jgi:hypothetical protein
LSCHAAACRMPRVFFKLCIRKKATISRQTANNRQQHYCPHSETERPGVRAVAERCTRVRRTLASKRSAQPKIWGVAQRHREPKHTLLNGKELTPRLEG